MRTIGKLIWHPFLRFLTDGGNQYAGNIAFLTFLALFPFLIFLTTLATFLEGTEAVNRFIAFILEASPPVVSQALEPMINDVVTRRSGSLLTLSILGTLWVSASAIEALRTGLNKAYRVTHPRSFLYQRLQGVALVILAAGTILLSMAILVLLPATMSLLSLSEESQIEIDRILALGRYVAVPLVVIGMGVIFYRFLPKSDYGWLGVLPGSILSFFIWFALVQVFSAYIRNFESFSLIYGSLGGVIALLLFLYFSAAAFLVGAEFNVVLRECLRGEKGTTAT